MYPHKMRISIWTMWYGNCFEEFVKKDHLRYFLKLKKWLPFLVWEYQCNMPSSLQCWYGVFARVQSRVYRLHFILSSSQVRCEFTFSRRKKIKLDRSLGWSIYDAKSEINWRKDEEHGRSLDPSVRVILISIFQKRKGLNKFLFLTAWMLVRRFLTKRNATLAMI